MPKALLAEDRQSCRDDRLVEIGQKQREHEAEHDRRDVLRFDVGHPVDISCKAGPILPTPAPGKGLVWRSAIASTFAASLELARAGKLQLRQDSAFGPIYLRSPPEAP